MKFDDAIDLLFGLGLGVLEDTERERAVRLLADEVVAQGMTPEVRRILLALLFAVPPHVPPAALKKATLERIAQEKIADPDSAAFHSAAPQKDPVASAEVFTCRHEEGVWEETGLPGVSFKKLFVDQQRDYVTLLLRLEAGATYPSHQHGGYEECLVLEGDVRSGEVRLRGGDYQRMTGGSLHHALYTQAGCLLLLIASQENEILAPH